MAHVRLAKQERYLLKPMNCPHHVQVYKSQPRSYRDVFGRSAPHDRYLLVATDSDEGHGWQMSNSPLDLRTETAGADPETPLRSRELLAVRMSADELPERLRQWLRGGKR